MANGDLGSINTNFTAPQLPDNPSTQQTLQFSEQIMQFSTAVSATESAINSIGNAQKGATSKMAQG